MIPPWDGHIDRSRASRDSRWNQDAIAESTLAIVGGGLSAIITAICAAGMGFGRILIVGTSAPPADRPLADPFALNNLKPAIAGRYRDVPTVVFARSPGREVLERVLGRIDVLIAEIDSQANCADATDLAQLVEPERRIYCMASTNSVSVSVGEACGRPPRREPCYVENALLASGLALGEARRVLCPTEYDTAPDGPIVFSQPPVRGRVADITIAGAGGTGNFLGLAAWFIVSSMAIYDADLVEESNMARCPWLGHPGQYKSYSLWESLKALRATVLCSPRAEFARSDWLDRTGPGAIGAMCTDTLSSRRMLASAACEVGVQTLNLGTSLFGGSLSVVGPGHCCLECRHPNLDARVAAESAARQDNNCGQRAEPSSALSNLVIAGAAGMLARRMGDRGFRFPGVLHYDAFDPKRLYIGSIRSACGCSREVSRNAA